MRIFLMTILFISSTFSKTYEVNKQHSFVKFEIDYMKVSKVYGEFKDYIATFDYSDNKLNDLQVRIKSNSIDTSDKKRNHHLRSPDFFNIKKYPFIDFRSIKFIYKNAKPIRVIGDLTIMNITKRTTFDLNLKGLIPDPLNNKRKLLFLEAKTKIKRKVFGLTWNRAMDKGGWVVGEEVDIHITVEANPTDQRPAFSRFMRNLRQGNSPVPKKASPQD